MPILSGPNNRLVFIFTVPDNNVPQTTTPTPFTWNFESIIYYIWSFTVLNIKFYLFLVLRIDKKLIN